MAPKVRVVAKKVDPSAVKKPVPKAKAGAKKEEVHGDLEHGILWYPRKPDSSLPEVLYYRAGLPNLDDDGRREAGEAFFLEDLRCFGRKPGQGWEAKDTAEGDVLKNITPDEFHKELDECFAATAKTRNLQRGPMGRFQAAALMLGPRQALLHGSPSVLEKIEKLCFESKKAKEDERINSLICMQHVAWASPLLISDSLRKLVDLEKDVKIGKVYLETAVAVVEKFTPRGHGVCQSVLPYLVGMVEDKSFKLRLVGCILLVPCMKQLKHTTKQLSECLSTLLPALLEGPLMEPRKEVQEAARQVLEVIAKMVRNSEVNALSADVVQALADPANQQYTQDALAKLGSTTFMNYIDAPSLALLVPIMVRGLREREQKSRKWSAQILGAIVMLVKDIEYLRPYLPQLLPMLKECVVDPTYEIQREAAKAFGMLTQELPDYSRRSLQPWLCQEICSRDPGSSLGAAHALSEVLLRMDKSNREEYISAVEEGARSPEFTERSGFLNLLDFLPQALKNEYARYITRTFPAMLAGVLPEHQDPGWRAAHSLVDRFAVTAPELLLPGLEDLFFASQHETLLFPTAVKHQGCYLCKLVSWQMREIYLKFLLQLCERILEHRKYGQDMLSCEDVSTRAVREEIISLVLVMIPDTNAQVSRQAKNIYRVCGGGPRTPKDILPTLEARLLRMRMDPLCAMKRAAADGVLKEMAEANELSAEDNAAFIAQLPEPPPLEEIQQPTSRKEGEQTRLMRLFEGEAEAAAASGRSAVSVSGGLHGGEDRQGVALKAFEAAFPPGSWDAAGPRAEAARTFAGPVTASVAVEALSARGLFGELKANLTALVRQYAAGAVDDAKVVAAARSVACAVFGQDAQIDDLEDDVDVEKNLLLRVNDMMLMYGGGHLLLKDTMLEIKRGHRYGVVGHNGCGKTTLMKELQAGRVAGMPAGIRCVHVSDADLGNMKILEMNALEFVKQGMSKLAAVSAEEALQQVGFPREMQEKAVADLSGGWRMRLILAVAMMKQADILLLDEPTNHLDVHAIEWLCQYLLRAQTGALMVISHDPHFLNAVCTDIIQYREKKLVYYQGNFDSFKQAQGITEEDADAYLAGNLKLEKATPADPAAADAGGGESKGDDPAAPDGGRAPSPTPSDPVDEEDMKAPEKAKLVFPIPGKLEGIRTNVKPVMELKDVWFQYAEAKGFVIKGMSCKLNLGSRVALVGANGAGKSTLLGLMCGELMPTEIDGKVGEAWQHHNMRLSYIAQHHMTSLGKWYNSSPFTYLSYRFQNGYDEEAQRHLIDPEDDEEKASRRGKAAEFGKYGKQIGSIVGRTKQNGKLVYEVQWEGMEDAKQNTFETIPRLRQMGCEKIASACDLRIAASSGGLDQRVCSRREIVKHLEQFGIDEEMTCNRQIGGFSAGQKSKLALACSVWTRPHLIALDEPTNYLDIETVESLARALRNFRGGVVVVTHSRDFIEKVCTEEWLVEGGTLAISKLDPRAAEDEK